MFKVSERYKGGSKLKLGNCWPISILPAKNKVSKTILHRIDWFLEKYGLFTNCQFGFRRKHLTNLAIAYLHETILKEPLANKSVCVFVKCFYILQKLLTALIIKLYWINLNNTLEDYFVCTCQIRYIIL